MYETEGTRAVIQPVPVSSGTSQLCPGARGQVLAGEAYSRQVPQHLEGGLAPYQSDQWPGDGEPSGEAANAAFLDPVGDVSVCKREISVCVLKISLLSYM